MVNSERGLALIDKTARMGVLSKASQEAIRKSGEKYQLSLGKPLSEVEYKSDLAHLVGVLIDDSGSIGTVVIKDPKTGAITTRPAAFNDNNSNAEAVRIGHNAVVAALKDTQKPSDIWFNTRYLNGREINPWDQLQNAKNLDRRNYTYGGGTPLYDQTVAILGSIIAKSQEFRNKWKMVRTAVLIVTDGADTESKIQTAASVKSVITDMYNMGIHIIAGMGIYDGKTNYRNVLLEMGVRENLILTPGSTPEEIRRAFGLFGKMAARATSPQEFNNILANGFLALPPGER